MLLSRKVIWGNNFYISVYKTWSGGKSAFSENLRRRIVDGFILIFLYIHLFPVIKIKGYSNHSDLNICKFYNCIKVNLKDYRFRTSLFFSAIMDFIRIRIWLPSFRTSFGILFPNSINFYNSQPFLLFKECYYHKKLCEKTLFISLFARLQKYWGKLDGGGLLCEFFFKLKSFAVSF